MKKYYELSLNFARVRDHKPFSNSCGFIRVLPMKGLVKKEGVFGPRMVEGIEYIGEFKVIAEVEDDHFKDSIAGNIIQYDPDGLQDITTATIEELKCNLDEGLTCYHFREVEDEVALFYISKVIYDEKALSQYIHELDELTKKENVLKEINKREDAMQISPNKKKTTNTKTKKLIKSMISV